MLNGTRVLHHERTSWHGGGAIADTCNKQGTLGLKCQAAVQRMIR